ncbi:epoxide hydrolase family protein [Sphingorhabdus arenilitoris]|uniref:Epoxide hydrolase family protein n=1 Tax=Sphingorhabdus arenilitoris TaxID=1490041 RepID=A0ABV8RKE5_9SPHN
MTANTPRPFTVNIAQQQLDDLQTRLSLTRFPEKETVDDWDQGIPLAYVQELTEYWRDQYNWRRCEQLINGWPNYLAEIDGLDIHFLHIRSENPNARPIIMTHGWPGSVLEFAEVIEPLSRDFHLIIPSLPGYGFSAKPTKPGWDIHQIARAWHTLMTLLGYDRWFAQGGDWGAAVTDAIGQQNLGGCAGLHVNMVIARPDPKTMADLTQREQGALARMAWYQAKDNGYSTQHATRPQTIGYGLADSPTGQMAWIIEKFHGWADCGHNDRASAMGGHPENIFSRDHLLDNVMLYWLNNCGASSARLYWHSFRDTERADIILPVGGTVAPYEIFGPSRRWAEQRMKNIVYWSEPDKGGHFLAMERPQLFVEEVRAAFAVMEL